ncbi:chemoreceptor glutamine deamidase CheD [Glaciecola petra]|uniref:Probable chemoreceptor glutamine deamidase CheD n=1 Tax=Glaciecola petra TaxID=3075602 RepID=A0ABU2ZRH5_9ALTE|nr:chemoreceptor glutamine deamidase CheD [Aestuariibacter sp. P117]MDT0595225.1 chemoreceptor glutamine deamidase CheD [Aestuariibacter sp. P117]
MSEFFSDDLAPNRYFDKNFNIDAVKILPGEYFATQDSTLIVTVLGSCVSVCLRDPITRVAGMNHFLLPANKDDVNFNSESARYGSYAMEVLINHLMKLGAGKQRLEAKVFGGANVLQQLRTNSVGEQNVSFIRDFLATENIKVQAEDLLGEYPRKVYFFPLTGEVKVRKLKSLHNTTILERESEYRKKVNTAPASGDVDLF